MLKQNRTQQQLLFGDLSLPAMNAGIRGKFWHRSNLPLGIHWRIHLSLRDQPTVPLHVQPIPMWESLRRDSPRGLVGWTPQDIPGGCVELGISKYNSCPFSWSTNTDMGSFMELINKMPFTLTDQHLVCRCFWATGWSNKGGIKPQTCLFLAWWHCLAAVGCLAWV